MALPVLVMILLSASLSAQSALPAPARVTVAPRQQPPKADGPTVRAAASLVLVPVAVRDRSGRLVTDLRLEHFRLLENGQERPVTHFAQEDAAVSVGILLDTSRSMKHSLAHARVALHHFLQAAYAEDEFFLVTFADRAEIRMNYTSSEDQIRQAASATEADGGTALFDAVLLALQRLRDAHQPRRALLVLSDGGESASRLGRGEVKRLAQEADVRIFAVVLRDWFPEENFYGAQLLRELAELTGGRYLEASRPRDMPGLVESIDIHRHYVLGFPLPADKLPGKYHRIQVRLTPPAGHAGLRADWRRGYVAPQN